jgi:hypothetical protein
MYKFDWGRNPKSNFLTFCKDQNINLNMHWQKIAWTLGETLLKCVQDKNIGIWMRQFDDNSFLVHNNYKFFMEYKIHIQDESSIYKMDIEH